VKKPKPRKIQGIVNVSHGDRPRCQKVSQRMSASAKNAALIASVSITRPLSITSNIVNQEPAAIVEPAAPRTSRVNEINRSATIRTGTADGRRAAHSFRIPNARNDAATSQLIKGGLFTYGRAPR